MKQYELQGIRTNWEAFEAVQKERWELVSLITFGKSYHCKVHDVLFYYDLSEDGEPCWACYDEFTERR